ncbi:winged helix-turn-helix transcriptional regulator [Buttiauxella warmboldiae]|uniref:Winged helix-turn-helix transcriptional regulator n=1 Tax=Buttiauxella warmboldiae TaxID=82993 RepID=A0A3N5DHB2_9ENTR|nr:winged helix-turn-helix transcriptional regulator [Buttiauxella warmboldiae]RPH26887.1 winged helix-turn-helix transcriptional regulator [Buttiauxella warmboldiae]
MLYINKLSTGTSIFKALSSAVRISILEILNERNGMNMNALAEYLGISNGAVTMHIKKLEDAGLIKTVSNYAKNGIQKNCYVIENKILIEFGDNKENYIYESDLKVGQYSNFQVTPTCGMATKEMIIGEFDNPQVFADPKHIDAGIIWFTTGFLEYRIPNYSAGRTVSEIQISFEIGSEAPYYNDDWPSDIHFSVNGMDIGYWQSPGDIGGIKYSGNPIWWPPHLNQYGFLKLLRINNNGSFIDGRKISDINIAQILHNREEEPFILRFSVHPESENPRGLTLYGQNFGRYEQGILARIIIQS